QKHTKNYFIPRAQPTILSAGERINPRATIRCAALSARESSAIKWSAQEMEESVGRIDRSPEQLAIAGSGSLATVPTPRIVALIHVSRLRSECVRLALAQHNAHWRVSEFASAEELQRALDGGAPAAELVLIGAATAEHVDLRQLELVCETLPETPVVVIAEN